MKSPYNRGERKELLNSVVVFADVLGFSQEMQKLEEFFGNPYIRSKYVWVANYHNFFCDQYLLGSTLKIEGELLQITPQRIDEEFEIAKAAIRS